MSTTPAECNFLIAVFLLNDFFDRLVASKLALDKATYNFALNVAGSYKDIVMGNSLPEISDV
jgi:hypothetical protein